MLYYFNFISFKNKVYYLITYTNIFATIYFNTQTNGANLHLD
jgi:hypothetical protein